MRAQRAHAACCNMLQQVLSLESFPELGKGPNSADIPDLTRSELGGEAMHSQDGAVSGDPISGLSSDRQSREGDNEEGNQRSIQGSVLEVNRLQGAIEGDAPVAPPTKRRQRTAPIRTDGREGELEQGAYGNEAKELIRHVGTQIKEQHHIMDDFSSAAMSKVNLARFLHKRKPKRTSNP
jgi:hypothetical protein